METQHPEYTVGKLKTSKALLFQEVVFTYYFNDELTNLTAGVPEWQRLQIRRILPLGPWIDATDLSSVVPDKVCHVISLRGELCRLALSERGHVVIFPLAGRGGKVVEVDGVDVVDAVGQLLGDFL